MKFSSERLYPGDIVEVKTPDEILQTLDADGTLGHLPFMPEMVEFCGKQFHVSMRVLKTCISGSIATMLGFRTDDVVLLDDLRCSGAAHEGCEKTCTIFGARRGCAKSTPPAFNHIRIGQATSNYKPVSRPRAARRPIFVRPANC